MQPYPPFSSSRKRDNARMLPASRRRVTASLIAALITFLVVQDRVTYYATVRYAELVRAATVSHTQAPAIDDVMPAAVAQSIRLGLLWGGVVFMGGLGFTALRRRRQDRRQPRRY